MTRLTDKQLQTAVANGAKILHDEPRPVYHPALRAVTVDEFERERPSARANVRKVIPMPAFGKERPRVTRNGTYMPHEYEQRRKTLRRLFGPVPDGLVRLSVTAVRAMPKSWSVKKRAAARGQYAKPKPDLDNIIGGIMDALFTDDDLVVAFGPCSKIWGDEHQLIIEVEQV